MPRASRALRRVLRRASAYRHSSALPARHRFARTRPLSLQGARERAAVEQDILAGDETGLGAAQERAGIAEFFGVAETSRRIELCAFGQHFVDRNAALLCLHLHHRTA